MPNPYCIEYHLCPDTMARNFAKAGRTGNMHYLIWNQYPQNKIWQFKRHLINPKKLLTWLPKLLLPPFWAPKRNTTVQQASRRYQYASLDLFHFLKIKTIKNSQIFLLQPFFVKQAVVYVINNTLSPRRYGTVSKAQILVISFTLNIITFE